MNLTNCSSVTPTSTLEHLNALELIQASEKNPRQPSWVHVSRNCLPRITPGRTGLRDTAGCRVCGLSWTQGLVELSLNLAPSSPIPVLPHL